MILGVVRGTLVATIEHGFYQGRKKLLVDLTDADFQPTGGYLIAIDAVDAGVGQRVLVMNEGNGARQICDAPGAPVRSVIVGIVDEVTRSEPTMKPRGARAPAAVRPPRRRTSARPGGGKATSSRTPPK